MKFRLTLAALVSSFFLFLNVAHADPTDFVSVFWC